MFYTASGTLSELCWWDEKHLHTKSITLACHLTIVPAMRSRVFSKSYRYLKRSLLMAQSSTVNSETVFGFGWNNLGRCQTNSHCKIETCMRRGKSCHDVRYSGCLKTSPPSLALSLSPFGSPSREKKGGEKKGGGPGFDGGQNLLTWAQEPLYLWSILP